MEQLSVKAYAKINLTLDVLGKRDDGYHEVRIILQPLELHDLVHLRRTEGECRVVCDDDGVPDGEGNLALRAAKALAEVTGFRGGAEIWIEKAIPVAAGLAGGSADAAAVLSGLNRLWGLDLPIDELIQIGARLGSDVPYCLLNRTCLAEGRGEILTPLPPAPRIPVVLARPAWVFDGHKTAEVYRRWGSARAGARPDNGAMVGAGARPDSEAMIGALKTGDPSAIVRHLANALEPAAVEMCPAILPLKDALAGAGALGVALSGSGPTVFALADSPESAEEIARAASPWAERVIKTATLVPGGRE
jgi:4-diphosphocytidyl-2-C-methyl-D-erythritol kinase